MKWFVFLFGFIVTEVTLDNLAFVLNALSDAAGAHEGGNLLGIIKKSTFDTAGSATLYLTITYLIYRFVPLLLTPLTIFITVLFMVTFQLGVDFVLIIFEFLIFHASIRDILTYILMFAPQILAKTIFYSTLLWLIVRPPIRQVGPEKNIRIVSLLPSMRTLDRLNVIRSLYHTHYGILFGLLIVLIFNLSIASNDQTLMIIILLLIIVISVYFSLSIIMSNIATNLFDWRFGIAFFTFVSLLSIIWSNLNANVGLIAIIYPAILFGLLIRLLLSSDVEFRTARGWKPETFWSAARQTIGIPGYVSSAAPLSASVNLLFIGASVLGAFWRCLPLILWSTALVPTVSILEGDVAQLWDVALSALFTLGVAGFLAYVAEKLAQQGRRGIVEIYRRAVDEDDRRPALYLRAFKTDGAVLPSRRHGILPRLFNDIGLPRTLDAILLDRISPYAPVLAIGKPGEELPPFGAARVYVQGDDWQSVVRSLATESALIVIALDDTPGVEWEINFLIENRLTGKSLFLLNPFARPEERSAILQKLFGRYGSGSRSDVIGVTLNEGRITLYTSPYASREAYACAVGMHLEGVKVIARPL